MSESVSATEISWTPVLEQYLAETGEKALGHSWIHTQAEHMYSQRRTWIDLPVVVGSGVIGFLSAGSNTLFRDPEMSSIYLGIGSLVVGVLNTVGSYFGWAKRAEGHRIAGLSYAKLYRFLRVELGLPRSERMRPGDLLKMVKQEIDRLAETSPQHPPSVIAAFKARFKTETVAKPETTNGLHRVEVYAVDEIVPVSPSQTPAGVPPPLLHLPA
jgi:hypothetical protein